MNPVKIAHEAVKAGAAQKTAELAELVALVLDLDPQVILEIGSMVGGSLVAWQLAAPDAEIISVSLTDGPYGGGDVKTRIDHWLDMNSHDPDTLDQVDRILGGRPVDFLFIDGDHSLEGVTNDFEMYSPLVRPGGLIAFHDILPHDPSLGIGVERLWDRLASSYDAEEIVVAEHRRDYGVWGGIGVIHW